MTTGFDPMGMEVPQADLDALQNLASSHAGSTLYAVEIGAWAGHSTRTLAESLIRGYGWVYAVDTWEGSPWEDGGQRQRAYPPKKSFQTFCKNMGEHLFETVFPCVGRSLTWAAIWTLPIDLLFIDADHRYESVKADLLAWIPHVRTGGKIILHDYGGFEGVTRAVDELFGPGGFGRCGFSLAYVTKGKALETSLAEQAAFTADDFWPQEKSR